MPSATTSLSPSPVPNSGKACACEHHYSKDDAPVEVNNGYQHEGHGYHVSEPEENIGDLNTVFGAVQSDGKKVESKVEEGY